ncbi:TnsA endonuclease N-terminal domain-containing protein [Anoxybacteroides tepidamans]|uniref:TnsA endonuclease N-terminal domain-containing protein n=1 Tax=Anoxybacteroides tepidamans TaxID=265948 RepID=UPI000686A835|nr:TnsA endonuclease N-terminal domain-containing protein [Anoxybacillus tepidamans]
MYQPIDIPRNKKFGNNYWEVFSPKLNRTVKLYSDLEYDHWLLIESDPSVRCYCEQPLKIQLYWNNKLHQSIFDMWILYDDNSESFIEIKYSNDLIKPKVMEQLSVQQQWCNEHNKRHVIATEKDIRSNQVRLANARLMVSFLKSLPKNTVQTHSIYELIQQKQRMTVSEIRQSLTELGDEQIFTTVCYLLHQSKIKGDINQAPINKDFEVWV